MREEQLILDEVKRSAAQTSELLSELERRLAARAVVDKVSVEELAQ